MSNERYTPHRYVEAAWTVLGDIDLDPVSCAFANRTCFIYLGRQQQRFMEVFQQFGQIVKAVSPQPARPVRRERWTALA